ncbi:MAG: hypothetical protein EHM12_09230 [Dehalococcoidia bacterium]|nr:MAG: hypothetical protein EHM12_09230 [Dehalococcoidia bacterium]
MKIALPLESGFIAPTFDFATQLMVVACAGGAIIEKQVIDISGQLPSLRAAQLKALDVNTLICGAISNPLAVMVWHQGIDIISGLSGAAHTILKECLGGKLPASRHTLPGFSKKTWKGYCGRRQRRFRSGR